jgi:hypothetical protein
MAETVKLSEKQTGLAGGLSSLLDQLEGLIGKFGVGFHQDNLQILTLMDAIAEKFKQLHQQGAIITGEENQYENACRALQRQAGTFIRAVGGVSALRSERSHRNPPADAWWWYLDDYVAQKRRSMFLRTALILGVIGLLVVVFGIVYQKYLAPGPEVTIPYQAYIQATDLLARGNVDEALIAVQKGLDVVPNKPDLLIIRGVILTLQGHDQAAVESFDQVRAKVGDEAFYLARAQVYVFSRSVDLVKQDARAALAINPKSAVAYLMFGTGQELEGDGYGAYESYTRASDLAEASGDSTLVSTIRVRLGMLMQRADFFQPTPTATAKP